MEFLQALQQAQQQGVTTQQFLPIWQAEAQLLQHREEVKLTELKIQLAEQHKTENNGLQYPSDIETFLRNELTALKSTMLVHQQAILQVVGDITTLFSSVITPGKVAVNNNNIGERPQVTPRALIQLLQQNHPADKEVEDLYDLYVKEKPSSQPNQNNRDIGKHDPNSVEILSNQTLFLHPLSPKVDFNASFSDEEHGTEWKIPNISKLALSGECVQSDVLYIPHCPFAFTLSLSFNFHGELYIQLGATPIEGIEMAVDKSMYISGKGYIQDVTGKYYQAWEIGGAGEKSKQRYNRKLKPNKEKHIHAAIELKKNKHCFDSLTVQDLQSMNFTADNTLIMRWVVETTEVKYNPTSDKSANPAKKTATGVVSSLPLGSIVDGFTINKVSEMLHSSTVHTSQSCTFLSCPCTFRISASFNPSKKMILQLLVSKKDTVESDECPFSISCFGEILNKNSSGFSPFWQLKIDGTEWKYLQVGQEIQIEIPTCLKTKKATLQEVTYDVLADRQYFHNDTLTIQWFMDILGHTKEVPVNVIVD